MAQIAETRIVRIFLDLELGQGLVGDGQVPEEGIRYFESLFDDQRVHQGGDDIDAHPVEPTTLVPGGRVLVFVIEGLLRKGHLSNGGGFSIDFDQSENLHPPVGGKSHPFKQIHMKGHLSGQLIVEAQEEIDQSKHLIILAIGELPFECQEEGIQKEPFHTAVHLSLRKPCIKCLGEVVVQHHHGIEQSVKLNAPERPDVRVDQPDGMGAQGHGDPEAQEHVLALAGLADVESSLVQLIVNRR